MMTEPGMRGMVTVEPLDRASKCEVGVGCAANLCMAAAIGPGVGVIAEAM